MMREVVALLLAQVRGQLRVVQRVVHAVVQDVWWERQQALVEEKIKERGNGEGKRANKKTYRTQTRRR
jgi:hypothetical protein